MDAETFETFREWLDALIDKKIEQAFGRDSLTESIRETELRKELREKLA